MNFKKVVLNVVVFIFGILMILGSGDSSKDEDNKTIPSQSIPIITLLGDSNISVNQDTIYIDSGATANDAEDGNITSSIVTINPVDTSTIGRYTITYDVNDSSGNQAFQVRRVVNVLEISDTTPPTITLIGNAEINVTKDATYTDAGATANDNIDGDISTAIVIYNSVDTSTVGSYTITYDVNDSNGNQAVQVRRVVNVVTPPPLNVILNSISISENSMTLRVDGSKTFVVTGLYSDNSSRDISSDVSFIINDSSIFSISGATISPLAQGTTTFRATFNGKISNIVTVTVSEALNLEKNVKNSLFDQYKDIIPSDSTAIYSSDKFAIITGIAKDKSDTPLVGVRISILNHSEFGSVLTDSDGQFNMPIEGGKSFTLNYIKDGYLPLDREVDVPVQNWAYIDDVAMSVLDTKVTEIDLSSATPQIHVSSKINDSRGERETTLVFDGITKAIVTRKDGSTYKLDKFEVRATEFDTPESMPSKLPDGTAFTYCVDLSVDRVEAGSHVNFNKNVILYLDNFLEFDVGEIVPVGFYNEQTGKWEAYDNGVVVKLLDSNGDGKIDGLDSTGDDIADDLNGEGSTEDEVVGIKDNPKYIIGKTYWRAEIPHFSRVDLNWGKDIPDNPNSPDVNTTNKVKDPDPDCGDSYVETQNQVYHEDIPIAGTNISLNYTSDRIDGYKHRITAKITGDNVSSTIVGVTAKFEVAGRTFTKTLPISRNQTVEFVWNGLDNRGKKVEGVARGKISVEYKYQAYYLKAPWSKKSFGKYSTMYTSVIAGAMGKKNSQEVIFKIPFKNQKIAEGWSLSNHHFYNNGVTLKGNGLTLDKKVALENGLVAYWKFEDNAVDSSGTGNHGVAEGNIAYINGKVGNAIKFDGKTALVRTSSQRFSREFTIGYWLRVDSYVTDYFDSPENTIFENTKASDSLARFGMYFTKENKIKSFVRGDLWNHSNIITNNTINFNEWNYIVFRKKGNMYQIYINGILDIEKEITYPLLQDATFFGLGDDMPNDGNAKLDGALDEFRIYDRALSADEILSLYQNNKLDSYGDGFKVSDYSLTYLFDITGKHLKTLETQTEKVLTTFEYDSNDNLIAIKDRFNNTTTIERDGEGKATAIVAPNGQRTELSIDAEGNLVDVGYEDNSHYGFVYNDGGLMTSETEPNGNIFSHQFDANGRIIKVSDQVGGWKSYNKTDDSYTVTTAEGNVRTINMSGIDKEVITPSGSKMMVDYGNSEMSKTTTSCGIETRSDYAYDEKTGDKFIHYQKVTLPSGKHLARVMDRSYTYNDDNTTKTLTIKDTLKNGTIAKTVVVNDFTTTTTTDYTQGLTTITSPKGRIAKRYFDTTTLLPTKDEVAGLESTTYSYDTKGRLISTKIGERESQITYDTKGNIATITDAKGETTSMEYDVLGRVVKVTSPLGAEQSFEYDKNGNLLVISTPNSNEHQSVFNAVNRQTSQTSPLSHSTTYSYDKERKLTKIIYPSTKEKQFVYTNAQLTSIATGEGTAQFEYDCLSNLTKTTYGTESIEYGYDGSLLKSIKQQGILSQTIALEYNNEFRPSKLTYANGSDTMSYDNDGLLIKQGSFNISRDATNGLALGIDNGTLQSSRTYNSYGELKEIEDRVNNSSIFGYSTTRNRLGKIITKTETIAGQSHDYAYEYNSDGRLTKVTKDGTVVESYSYDANGNRADATVNEDDQVVTYHGTTYSYNADGYLTSKTDSEGTTTYQYGIWGELQKVVLADGKVIEYLHNANHQRVAKKVNGAVVEKYLWLDLTTLLATYDKDNNLISRFNYADERMPRSMQRETDTYYLHYDQVGTLKLITNSSGATIKEIEYDSFGNILNDSNPSFVVPFGFAGGLYDSDTKLTRFGYRDYDGFSGRWTAKDPIGFSGGDSNLYGYVLGDPVNFVDSNGLDTQGISISVSAGEPEGFFSFSIGLFWDDKGNWAIQFSSSAGKPYGATVGIGIGVELTNADTICDLAEGLENRTEFAILPIVGGSAEIIEGDGYHGLRTELSLGIGYAITNSTSSTTTLFKW